MQFWGPKAAPSKPLSDKTSRFWQFSDCRPPILRQAGQRGIILIQIYYAMVRFLQCCSPEAFMIAAKRLYGTKTIFCKPPALWGAYRCCLCGPLHIDFHHIGHPGDKYRICGFSLGIGNRIAKKRCRVSGLPLSQATSMACRWPVPHGWVWSGMFSPPEGTIPL